jgi:hypothetical protein
MKFSSQVQKLSDLNTMTYNTANFPYKREVTKNVETSQI